VHRPLLDEGTVAVLPGPPGRPGVTRVEGTSVSLEWTAPGDSGAATISRYVVNVYVISGSNAVDQYDTVSVEEVTTSYTITGRLQECRTYKFAVAAATNVGQGPSSELSDETWTNRGLSFLVAPLARLSSQKSRRPNRPPEIHL